MKCTICSKYQQIYGVPAKNLVKLRTLWLCGLNPDPKNNTCLQNVTATTRSPMDLSSAATITTSGPFTSVVSRYCSSNAARPAAIPQRRINPAQNACRPTFRYIASHPHKLIKHSEQEVPENGLSLPDESFSSGIQTSRQLNAVSERPNMTGNSSRNTLYSDVTPVLNNSTPLKQYAFRTTLDSMPAACDAPIQVSTSKVRLSQTKSVNNRVLEPNIISSSVNELYLNNHGKVSSIGASEKNFVCTEESATTESQSSHNVDYNALISFIPTNIPFHESQAGVNMPSSSTTNTTPSSTISLSTTNTSPLPTSGPLPTTSLYIPPLPTAGPNTAPLPTTGPKIAPLPTTGPNTAPLPTTGPYTAPLPATGPYITVIPKSIWNTLASETLNQIIAQQNLK